MEEITLRAYLHLLASPAIGTRTLSRLLESFGSLKNLCTAPRRRLLETGLTSRQCDVLASTMSDCQVNQTATLEQALSWQDEEGHQLIVFESDGYPRLLREISTPPPILFAHGNSSLLHRPACAIVGSRRANAYGIRQAKWIAHELADAGFTVVSGLARGIDAAAHDGALLNSGNTIGVIGTGIDRVYPACHKNLHARIANTGLLVSEFPIGAPPKAAHFPRRNRIISGLSLGTVVMEASLRSGSLITARLAIEQNRDVFAVPGPIDSNNSHGCHKLLREGAKLVESPQDIYEELLSGWHAPASKPRQTTENFQDSTHPENAAMTTAASDKINLSKTEGRILQAINEPDVLVDSLLSTTGLSASTLTASLMQLEIKGLIENRGGRFSRCQ